MDPVLAGGSRHRVGSAAGIIVALYPDAGIRRAVAGKIMLAVILLLRIIRRREKDPAGVVARPLRIKGNGDLLFASQQAGAVRLCKAQVISAVPVQI